ncbi:MAG: FHA domain-containing protein [Planctomycetaceae bacterium]|nr:FHA domain-containing protein [Planctomycetaceae bacterium]MBT6460371.1 FHA domain-containing protein [Planctomycetaceae bacterium]
MKLQLVFKTAKSKGKKSRIYDVDLPVVIGRGQRASFRIPHGQISRCHCELLESKGSVFVRDLGSTNGTMVKGTMLPSKTKVPVPSGSVIKLGELAFRVQYAATTDGLKKAIEDSFEEAIDFLEAEPEGETVEAFAEADIDSSGDKLLEVESIDDDLFLDAGEELDVENDDLRQGKSGAQESSKSLSDDDIEDFLSDI